MGRTAGKAARIGEIGLGRSEREVSVAFTVIIFIATAIYALMGRTAEDGLGRSDWGDRNDKSRGGAKVTDG